jgi:hypothetical protein
MIIRRKAANPSVKGIPIRNSGKPKRKNGILKMDPPSQPLLK